MPARAPSKAALAKIAARLSEIEDGSGDGTLDLGGGVTLDVSHLGKVLFPKEKVTKGEVMRYYVQVAPYLLPILQDRPLSLKRFPNGVGGNFFFQQKAPPNPPDAVRVESLTSEAGERQDRVIGGSLGTALYCVQIGAFEFNPWNTRVGSPTRSDFTVIDLDPGPKATFKKVIDVALRVGDALDHLGLHAGLKTSGATGIHIVLPLPPKADESVAERVPRTIASAVAGAYPKVATVERSLDVRGPSQVYVDAGQNSRGKTVASAYSVRAREGATVSTPLDWDELEHGLDPRDFTVRTVPDRLAETGDIWAEEMRTPNPLKLVSDL